MEQKNLPIIGDATKARFISAIIDNFFALGVDYHHRWIGAGESLYVASVITSIRLPWILFYLRNALGSNARKIFSRACGEKIERKAWGLEDGSD